jgi:shikimate 5-dehydrogenase
MGLFRGSGGWKLAARAALGALVGAGGLATPAATQAQATPIRHVVVIFLENTTAATFAGILAYTEHTFGLSPLGANDAAAYPFTSAVDYTQAPLAPARMAHRPLPASAQRIHLTPALENDPT